MVLSERQVIIFCTEITSINKAILISAKNSANYESPCRSTSTACVRYFETYIRIYVVRILCNVCVPVRIELWQILASVKLPG